MTCKEINLQFKNETIWDTLGKLYLNRIYFKTLKPMSKIKHLQIFNSPPDNFLTIDNGYICDCRYYDKNPFVIKTPWMKLLAIQGSSFYDHVFLLVKHAKFVIRVQDMFQTFFNNQGQHHHFNYTAFYRGGRKKLLLKCGKHIRNMNLLEVYKNTEIQCNIIFKTYATKKGYVITPYITEIIHLSY